MRRRTAECSHASLKHLRVIGSAAYVHVETYKTKLYQRAWEGKLVGYSPDSRAYRAYNPTTRKIVSSRNVTFIETMDVAMPPVGINDEDNEENVSSSSSDVSISENEGGNKDKFPEETEGIPDDSSSSGEEDSNRRTLRSDSRTIGEPGKYQANKSKRQHAELRRLSPWSKLANYVSQERTRIKSPSMEEPVRPPATIPTPTTCNEAMKALDALQWKAAMAKRCQPQGSRCGGPGSGSEPSPRSQGHRVTLAIQDKSNRSNED